MQMMEDVQPIPLILCMENSAGEEISLRIEPEDDFQTFLDKAKSVLGFDVDINSITRNQPVSLDDNIYQFLINSEQTYETELNENYSQILEQTGENDDLVYVLDDGTQIRASQIHFDNEDPPVDLTAEQIPFVKYAEVDADEIDVDVNDDVDVKNYNIVESPVSRWSSKNSSPKFSFINSLPFKLVCNNTSGFEAQFTKYLETNTNAPKTYATLNPVVNRNKSPRSLINDNFKNYNENFNRSDDFTAFTREEILNMFKDSPVASLPYKNPVLEKRRHVRKSDPLRLNKSWTTKSNYDDGVLIVDSESKNCFICGKYVENNLDKLYLFDNEDQKIHRSSPQKKMSRQLKIICESCLGENFRPCRMKGPNQCLNADEYLVIRNNQQYIFQKITDFSFKKEFSKEIVQETEGEQKKIEKEELVNVEIGSDGEIITKPVDNDPDSSDDVILIKDDPTSSEPEVVEPPEIDDVIDNLDDADEEVKEFLGKYQCDSNQMTELKCRFCDKVFPALPEVMEHCEIHKHEIEDDTVFPCPLCNYGYANVKWLKGHLKAAHEKNEKEPQSKEIAMEVDKEEDTKSPTPGSPIAKRTRSSSKKSDGEEKDSPKLKKETIKDINVETVEKRETTIEVEVKQENIVSSDDEIWIVHTGEEQLENILQIQGDDEKGSTVKKTHKCINCSQIFTTAEAFASHKCRKRGRKPKSNDLLINKDDVVKRPQGRPRLTEKKSSNDLLVERHRKKKNKPPTSDPQIVTCHNCNESFTSKVRLKFHMQFHETTSSLTSDGRYSCAECEGATFSTESELFDHVHFKHDKLKRWQCPVAGCGKTFFLRATLTKHSRSHTDTRRYVCVTCGKRFLDKQTLDEHGVTHLQIKPFQCHICLKQLTRRSRLRMHLRAHEEALAPKLVRVCAVCTKAFKNLDDAQEHATKSTECIEEFASELKEESEETQLSPTSGLVRPNVQLVESPKLSKPIKRQVDNATAEPLLCKLADEARAIIRVVEIEKAFRCEYCEDVFYIEEGLNNHRLIHKGVKNPFICHICKVAFATYSRCTTHKTTHGFYKRPLAEAKKCAETSNLKPEAGPAATGILGYGGFPVVKHFLCGDCGRSYLHWTYLQVHRRMKHANDNFLYKCNQCELTFPNSWSLAYHRKKLHCKNNEDSGPSKASREDYRIPCRDCEEFLPNKTALYKHRKKEHSDMSLAMPCKPGELWCDTCGKQFFTRAGLDTHHKTHAPCCAGSMPGNDEHFHSTISSHATGRPFRRSTVMRNQRSLPGVVSWSCARCPKRFRARNDLKTHMRLKHPAYLAVIEIAGLNPSPEEVLEMLRVNNIQHERIIEITKMSFAKGTSSVIPTCARALSLLGNVPQQPVDYQPKAGPAEYPPFNIVRSPRRPKILQRGDDTQDSKYPVGMPGELPLLEGSGMLRLQLDDSVMLQ